MAAGAGSTVAIIAAARARRIREVIDAFRLADATAPDRARSLEFIGARHMDEVDVLGRVGVLVHDPRTGAWWLSERAYAEHRDQQSRKAVRVLLAVLAIALVLVAAALLTTFNRG